MEEGDADEDERLELGVYRLDVQRRRKKHNKKMARRAYTK